MIFAAGFSRWMRRIEARASWSAAAVTVHVFRTTTSASRAEWAGDKPFVVSWRSRLAPSAWVARQPKLWTKNRGTKGIIMAFRSSKHAAAHNQYNYFLHPNSAIKSIHRSTLESHLY